MDLELILREIRDKHTRENFARIRRILTAQTILNGDWEVYQVTIPGAFTGFEFRHNLSFIPRDVILLSAVGDQNYQFRNEQFTRENIIIDTSGEVTLRFLAGRYREFDEVPPAGNVPISGGGGPPVVALNQIVQTMDCAASVAVNDWVYQDPSNDNTAITVSSNTQVEPTIGIVRAKPTDFSCEVILIGLYSGLSLSGRGKFYLSDTGGETFTHPSSGTGRFVRNLGLSFGNGTIYVNPEKVGLELDDG